jgi:hypothetical protein
MPVFQVEALVHPELLPGDLEAAAGGDSAVISGEVLFPTDDHFLLVEVCVKRAPLKCVFVHAFTLRCPSTPSGAQCTQPRCSADIRHAAAVRHGIVAARNGSKCH